MLPKRFMLDALSQHRSLFRYSSFFGAVSVAPTVDGGGRSAESAEVPRLAEYHRLRGQI